MTESGMAGVRRPDADAGVLGGRPATGNYGSSPSLVAAVSCTPTRNSMGEVWSEITEQLAEGVINRLEWGDAVCRTELPNGNGGACRPDPRGRGCIGRR